MADYCFVSGETRYLLFEGINRPTEKFYNRAAVFIDDYDYNSNGIDIEKIKISFRGLYSLFDKIANFINEYFGLGLNEKKVDFRRVWYLKQKINPRFSQSKNLPLRGLYLISKDLYFDYNEVETKKYFNVLEPGAKEINKIRNHLEHKFIAIKMFDIKNKNDHSERERYFSITEEELKSKSIYLGQLVREAIIYLSFAIHNEEKTKGKDVKYMVMPLFELEGKETV